MTDKMADPITVRWLCAFLSLASCFLSYADESWFNGSWVIDAERTKAEWIERKMRHSEGADKILAASKDLTWKIRDGIFGLSRDGSTFTEYAYAIRPVAEGGFEVLIDGLPYSEAMTIHRAESGFCATWFRFGWSEADYEERLHHIDCFKRREP